MRRTPGGNQPGVADPGRRRAQPVQLLVPGGEQRRRLVQVERGAPLRSGERPAYLRRQHLVHAGQSPNNAERRVRGITPRDAPSLASDVVRPRRSPRPGLVSSTLLGPRSSVLGHQILPPMSRLIAVTRTDRTIIVSSMTPSATATPSSARNTSGMVPSTRNVAASTMPAEVITPPVELSAISEPWRVPWLPVSSRTLVIRKML